MRPVERLEAGIDRMLYRPSLRALVFLWGGSNFHWARRALIFGLLVLVTGMIMDGGVFSGVLVGLLWTLGTLRALEAVRNLERMVGEASDAVSPAVLRECRVLSGGRVSMELLAVVLIGFAVSSADIWGGVQGLGFLLLSAGSAWGVDFLPPGKSLRSRIAEWVRVRVQVGLPAPAFG
jgi:hypothetical protein